MLKPLMFAAMLVLLPSVATADVKPDAKTGGWPSAQIGKEVSMPARDQTLAGFESDGDRGAWLQDRRQRWYYAKVIGVCRGLSFAAMIGVDARFSGDSFDRTGTLLVDGQRCPISSLTAATAPKTKPGRLKPGLNRIKRG